MTFEQTVFPVGRRTFRRLVAVAAIAGVAMSASMAGEPAPASAATQYTTPANYICGNGRIAVAPPRVWAHRGRTEQIGWGILVQRWSGSRWYEYSRHMTFGSFNPFGQNVTSWSMGATSRGGRYINSRYQVPVYHRGHYRIGTVLAGPNLNYRGFVGGPGTWCRI